MSKQDNIKAQQQFGDAINNGNLEALRNLVAPDVVDHDPAPDQDPGPEGYIHFFTMLGTGFPDMSIAVDHLVADDDNVAFAYTLTGTHQGPFMGYEATGKRISIRGMQISRFENGKMVERWGMSDLMGIMQQIGAVNS